MTLKLGTETGSLINHIYSNATKGQPTPEIGMGATLLSWSDRSPATIVSVKPWKDGWEIEVQEDHFKLISGSPQDGSAVYAYHPNPDAYRQTFRCADRDASWIGVFFKSDTKRWVKTGNGGLRIGERYRYYDPHF